MNVFFIIVGVFLLLLGTALARGRRIRSTGGRLTGRWGDAWLKTALIVVGITLFVIYIPAEVLSLDSVTGLNRDVQALIGTGVWAAGLLGSLTAIVWAQRNEHI